jgi:hypothetical protein
MLTRVRQDWQTASALGKIGRSALILVLAAIVGLGVWTIRPLFYATEVNEASPTEATVALTPLHLGSFTRVDAGHVGNGTATLFRDETGALILRLEDDFSVTNGPDLFIGLSGHPQPRSSAELHADGYLQLEPLKGSRGSQNYLLPADLDLSAYQSVVIYCRAFSVLFSTAELTPAS